MELVVVMGIVAIIGLATLPMGINFIRRQNLDDTTDMVVSLLRQAHTQTVLKKYDAAYGVKLLSDSYVLFQGSSYNSRVQSYDLVTPVSGSISFSGITEIVFEQYTGLPNVDGVIMITSGSETRSIDINEQGTVDVL